MPSASMNAFLPTLMLVMFLRQTSSPLRINMWRCRVSLRCQSWYRASKIGTCPPSTARRAFVSVEEQHGQYDCTANFCTVWISRGEKGINKDGDGGRKQNYSEKLKLRISMFFSRDLKIKATTHWIWVELPVHQGLPCWFIDVKKVVTRPAGRTWVTDVKKRITVHVLTWAGWCSSCCTVQLSWKLVPQLRSCPKKWHLPLKKKQVYKKETSEEQIKPLF